MSTFRRLAKIGSFVLLLQTNVCKVASAR